jgi:hypothetical protein
MDATNDFFAGSPSFKYNRSASSPLEFNTLRGQFYWVKDWQGEYSQERVGARETFRMPMVKTSNHGLDTDVEDIQSWESIYDHLGIEPMPACPTETKKVRY